MSPLLAALLVALAAAPAPVPAPKVVIIVRHAEAEPEAAGPQRQLTERGRERAAELARVLGETAVKTIYVTPLPRSRLTAEPFARKTGASLVEIKEPEKTLAALAGEPWGATIVVVAHSNTVPVIVGALTNHPFAPGEAVSHDRMWIVTLAHDGSTSVVQLRYGAPDAPI